MVQRNSANYTCEPGYMHASDGNSYLTCEVVGYDVEWCEDTIKCVSDSSFRKSWLEQEIINICIHACSLILGSYENESYLKRRHRLT